MKIEKEYKYLNIEKSILLTKIEKLESYRKIFFKRAVFDVPGRSGWMRLRSENAETKLAIKEKRSDGFTFETEISVGSFEETITILNYLGYKPRAIQENIRHEAFIEGCQVCLDEWPLIQPYVEIEFEDIDKLGLVENRLGLSEENRSLKDVESMYKEIGIDIKVTNVKF
jgi:adenylate cyclase, class 2